MSACPFLEVSSVEPLGGGRYAARGDAAWGQGAGLFGGVVFAWFVRALEREAGPGRPLRSLTCDLCAPVRAGPVELRARRVRAGRSVTWAAAELLQDGAVAGLATAVFAEARPADADFDRARAPTVPPPGAVAPWPRGEHLPTFTQFFEYRQALGGPPLAGGREALLGGWTGLVAPSPVDAALAVALLDAWPPALYAVLDRPRPAATVRATLDLLAPLPDAALDPAAPLLVTATSALTRDGYSAEDEALWAPDGRLLAQGRQLVALIR